MDEHLIDGICGTFRIRPLDEEWIVDYRPYGDSAWSYSSSDTWSSVEEAVYAAVKWDVSEVRRREVGGR